VGAKATETFVDSLISLYTRVLETFVLIKEVEALQSDLKKYYIIIKELSTLGGNLALRCGRLFMVTNAWLIATKHIDFQHYSGSQLHTSRDADGHPLSGVDDVPAQQSFATAEQLPSIAE